MIPNRSSRLVLAATAGVLAFTPAMADDTRVAASENPSSGSAACAGQNDVARNMACEMDQIVVRTEQAKKRGAQADKRAEQARLEAAQADKRAAKADNIAAEAQARIDNSRGEIACLDSLIAMIGKADPVSGNKLTTESINAKAPGGQVTRANACVTIEAFRPRAEAAPVALPQPQP